METSAQPTGGYLRLALGVFALAGAAGLGFALWGEHGPAMFLALAEQGLAWCF